MTYTYEFPRPSVTATIIALHMGKILVGTRSKKVEAFPGKLCLPGGFLNAKTDTFLGETIEEAAVREFKEECGPSLFQSQLHLTRVISDPSIDPRAHVINICFATVLSPWQYDSIRAGDDLSGLKFMSVSQIEQSDPGKWAFNHKEIALSRIYY